MRLIIHIGAGKTGTSSIQCTLDNGLEKLIEEGFFYAGRSFNSLGNNSSWKRRNFGFGLDKDLLTKAYISEYNKYVSYAEKSDCHTLVVCNEAFSGDITKLFDFFEYVLNLGHSLEICYFVRSPENWCKSAYEQWAIRHKTYSGNILSAQEYVDLKTYKTLIKPLEVLSTSKFYRNLNVFNLDSVDDAVYTFLSFYGLPKLEKIDTNQSVNCISLGLYYYLNNKHIGTVSNKKGRYLTNLYLQQESNDEYSENIHVKAQYYDKKDIIDSKRRLNDFLSDKQKFELEFKLKEKSFEKPTENEIKLIKLCVYLFEYSYQCSLRKELFIDLIDKLDEDARTSLNGLISFMDTNELNSRY